MTASSEHKRDQSDSAEPVKGDADPDLLRKVVVGAAGGALTAAGVVMLVTPGPGVLVTLGGLGILSTEFPIAQRALHGLRRRVIPTRDDENRGDRRSSNF